MSRARMHLPLQLLMPVENLYRLQSIAETQVQLSLRARGMAQKVWWCTI